MSKKKKIVRPQYVAKSERAKKAPKKPIARELKIGLIFCACALVLAIILFAVFYRDGSLAIQDARPVMEGDNWIVTNVNASGDPKYFKVGEVDAVEGYTLTGEEIFQSGRTFYDFRADDEQARIGSYYVTGINRAAETNAQTANSNYSMMWGSAMDISEVRQTEIAGRTVDYFLTETIPAEQEEDDTAATEDASTDAMIAEMQSQLQQQVICYVPAVRDTTVLVCATVDIGDDKPALAEEDLLAFIGQAVEQITFEEK